MDTPFSSARLLLEGAKESIDAFDVAATGFIQPDNWTDAQEFDRKTGEHVLKVRFKSAFPPRLALMTRRTFGELRDALDHALYASARLTTGKADPKRCKYPFGDTASAVEKEIIERCDDIHGDVLKIVIANAPHETGNRTLWAMNKIRNKDTHKILSPSGAEGRAIGITRSNGGDLSFSAVSEWRQTRQELTYGRAILGPNAEFEISPIIQVSLDHAFGFSPKTAVEVLTETYTVVSGLVDQIESATFRVVGSAGLSSHMYLLRDGT